MKYFANMKRLILLFHILCNIAVMFLLFGTYRFISSFYNDFDLIDDEKKSILTLLLGLALIIFSLSRYLYKKTTFNNTFSRWFVHFMEIKLPALTMFLNVVFAVIHFKEF